MEEEFHALRMTGADPMMVVSWAEDARRTGGFECEVTWALKWIELGCLIWIIL